MTIEEGKKLILEKDHQMDQLSLRDFADFCGYSIRDVYDITDRHYNPNIFDKVGGLWQLQEPRFDKE